MQELARKDGKQIDFKLDGIHDSSKLSGSNSTDDIVGFIPISDGVAANMRGVLPLIQLDTKETIIGLSQTYGPDNLIIVQTTKRIGFISLDKILGYTSTNTLDTQPTDIEESMAKAIIIHRVNNTAGTGGGTTTGNAGSLSGVTWEDAPFNLILSQLNADGTPASFVTSLSGVGSIGLSAGKYRLSGYSLSVAGTGSDAWGCRFLNSTSGSNLFSGLGNEWIEGREGANGANRACDLFGDFSLGTPAVIKLQHWMRNGRNTTGFGTPSLITQITTCVYRKLEIIKLD